MKATALYDFTLTAGGTQVILADANFYKVLTATGDIAVTRDGGATVKPIRAGRGERNVTFQRLILKDLSGAPNSGTILVGDSDFIDDTIVISSAINVRPEPNSGSFSTATGAAGAGATQVFAPASNTGGVILTNATMMAYHSAASVQCTLLAKSSAPSSINDGDVIMSFSALAAQMPGPQELKYPTIIEAGKGLYFYNASADSGFSPVKAARWKAL